MSLQIGEQTKTSLLTHSFSGKRLCDYPEYVCSLLMVKHAAASANRQLGLITDEIFKTVDESLSYLKGHSATEIWFPVDVMQGGGGIAINANINEAVALVAKQPEISTLINLSQSTADVCATAARLTILAKASGLDSLLNGLLTSFRATVNKNFHDVDFMARTCLQDAFVTNLKDFFSAAVTTIERHRKRLRELAADFTNVNIGGTVIGDGRGAVEGYRALCLDALQKISGQKLAGVEDLYASAQFCEDWQRYASEIASLMQTLSKLARDLRLLASGPEEGFMAVTLPKIIKGSSFFKDKNNPTMPETVIQAACLVYGKNASISHLAMQSELNLNVFEPAITFLVFDCINITMNILPLFDKYCLGGIAPGKKAKRHES